MSRTDPVICGHFHYADGFFTVIDTTGALHQRLLPQELLDHYMQLLTDNKFGHSVDWYNAQLAHYGRDIQPTKEWAMHMLAFDVYGSGRDGMLVPPNIAALERHMEAMWRDADRANKAAMMEKRVLRQLEMDAAPPKSVKVKGEARALRDGSTPASLHREVPGRDESTPRIFLHKALPFRTRILPPQGSGGGGSLASSNYHGRKIVNEGCCDCGARHCYDTDCHDNGDSDSNCDSNCDKNYCFSSAPTSPIAVDKQDPEAESF